jgi:hypothetical protein
VPDVVFWPYKALLLLSLVGSAAALLTFLGRPDDLRWAAPAYAGLLLHCYFLLTAAAQTGLPRYALAVWPLTATVVCGVIGASVTRRGA